MKRKGIPELPGKSKPYIMAHRGNRCACPENTLAAFQKAVQDGAQIIETDLHLTADDVFVCIHDPSVDRTTDGSGAVAEMRLKALKELCAGAGWPGYEGERIPTLKELLEILPPDVALALELKSDRFLEPAVGRRLLHEVQAAGAVRRTFMISFSLPRLQAMQSLASEMPVGWISPFRPLPRAGVDLLGVGWPLMLLNPLYVWIAHRRGQAVCPLDPRPDARLGLYLRFRCDAVLTDDPAATLAALHEKRKGPGLNA